MIRFASKSDSSTSRDSCLSIRQVIVGYKGVESGMGLC
jgi:hypothetical protein